MSGDDTGAHPIISALFEIIAEQGKRAEDVAWEAGLTRQALWSWKNRARTRGPSLDSLERVLDVLGYEIEIMKKDGGE